MKKVHFDNNIKIRYYINNQPIKNTNYSKNKIYILMLLFLLILISIFFNIS